MTAADLNVIREALADAFAHGLGGHEALISASAKLAMQGQFGPAAKLLNPDTLVEIIRDLMMEVPEPTVMEGFSDG